MTPDELLQVIDQAAKDGVQELDLSGHDLTSLPPEIGKLTALKTLILGKLDRERGRYIGNQLSQLPAEIVQLTSLQQLDLSDNQLSQLPAEIVQLTSLQQLDLRSNQLSQLPAEIVQLTSLQQLDLRSNQLSQLPTEIVQLTSLQQLYLSSNQLSQLPAEIVQLTSLQQLYLSSNQLSQLPAEIVQLTSLQQLYLSSNQLSQLPAEIGQLTSLQQLNLRDNQLSQLPAEIVQLTSLQQLNLSSNQLSQLPAEIGQLTSLQQLNLRDNQLSQLPAEIGQLTSLQQLNLSSNQLSQLPAEIGQLTSLQQLNLSSNQLSQLPAEIVQLTSLQQLNLSSNQLSQLPAEIVQLTSLQQLNLSSNQLSQLPAEIGQLTSLQQLDLRSNQLSQLPAEIGQLTSLQQLNLSSNQLSQLPAEIGQLTSLQQLYLSSNQLSQLPAEIGQLTSLQQLNLRDNQLSQLPAEILQLTNLKKLDLRGNPLPIPPEILGPRELWQEPGDISEIFNFYRQLQEQETDRLYEAKLLIIGEPGAGKTTLSKKIKDENYILNPDEISTEGIDVIQWEFPFDDGKMFQVNIWDFGGQEIYHATHQFFLTKRSLYALVADSRKEDTDFNYWLNVVELLSDNSPLLIVKNEKQDRKREINERQLRGEFTNLQEILATNLHTKRGLPELLDTIRYHVQKLPHVGTPLPKTWVEVRQALERAWEQDGHNYISLDEYLYICEANGFTQLDDKLQLSGYLHDLGVCLHFQEDSLLKKTVILNPTWGTDAVYAVLDNAEVVANLGQFTKDDLTRIWHQDQYATMRDELLQLMINFKLCYEIESCPDTYIAPQLLSPNQPQYDWDDTPNLRLKYKYEFMPKGILTRFIVEMHQWIDQQTCVWKTGVVLNQDQQNRTKAEVIELYRPHKGEINIRVSGSRKKDLLTVITYELDKIHASYGDRLKYDKLIPCNCTTCKENPKPYFYPLDNLRRALEARQPIQCQLSFEPIKPRSLLDDVFEPQNIEKELYPESKHRDPGTPMNFYGPVNKVIVQQNEEGDTMSKKTAKSSWANGLFYLFVFVVVIAAIGFTAGNVNTPTLALIIFAGILFIPIIGALQLMQDESISEKSFLKLMGMVFESLPIIKSFFPKQPPTPPAGEE